MTDLTKNPAEILREIYALNDLEFNEELMQELETFCNELVPDSSDESTSLKPLTTFEKLRRLSLDKTNNRPVNFRPVVN